MCGGDLVNPTPQIKRRLSAPLTRYSLTVPLFAASSFTSTSPSTGNLFPHPRTVSVPFAFSVFGL